MDILHKNNTFDQSKIKAFKLFPSLLEDFEINMLQFNFYK